MPRKMPLQPKVVNTKNGPLLQRVALICKIPDDSSQQICYGQIMGNEPEKSRETPQPAQQAPPPVLSIQEIHQRLQIVEKTEETMFDILKWGFGSFTVIVALVLGYNWITAKADYEKDKDSLKQQVEILEKQLAVTQHELTEESKKTLSDLKAENESALLVVSNSLQSELAKIQRTNDDKWLNVSVAMSSNAIKFGRDITTNLTLLDNNIHSEVDAALTNTVESINHALQTMETRITTETSKAFAGVGMAQAQLRLSGIHNAYDIQLAAYNYLSAALMSFRAQDQLNLRRAIDGFCNECIPELMKKASRQQYADLESQIPIQPDLHTLITELKSSDKNGDYTDALHNLEHASDLIKDKLSK